MRTPSLERASVRVQAGKGRQQRRMDIDQSTVVVADKGFAKNPHEAGQDHQFGRESVDGRGHGGVEVFAAGELAVVNDAGRHATRGRRFEPPRVGAVGEDGSDAYRQCSGVDSRQVATPYCCRVRRSG
jgi:hypothetical protein